MNYYNLKAILNSGKQEIKISRPSDSFSIYNKRDTVYIEPTFEKIESEEKPTIILVSAVGATGKTALAQKLSLDTKLPVLDLGKHKPVGDNSLTGLLTSVYDVNDISQIFQGLKNGSYGLIIDAIDEGRSKTNEKAFEAFLDDIVKLCEGSSATSFIILGRSQILDECWLYFSSRKVKSSLITISPFSIDAAQKYIDTFTEGLNSPYVDNYKLTRDYIIDKIQSAFVSNTKEQKACFLSFIGYPPVLDSIVTLLKGEPNYYKLLENLKSDNMSNVEIRILYRIASYILEREQNYKVIPNILKPLFEDETTPSNEVFSIEEQSARLIAYCLKQPLSLPIISNKIINDKYETQLLHWLPEHPFIKGYEFRNAVFEAISLATLINSKGNNYDRLINDYVLSHKHSYHLIYILDFVSQDHQIKISHLNAIISSAMEFRSVHATVECRIDGPEYDEDLDEDISNIDIEIDIKLGREGKDKKSFEFSSLVNKNDNLYLGSKLNGLLVTVPCNVSIMSEQEIELIAPFEINAKSIELNAKNLIVRANAQEAQCEIILNAYKLEYLIEKVTVLGASFEVNLHDANDISYPLISYVRKVHKAHSDRFFHQKFLRLKRILTAFRSHSKGALARFKKKIEHQRVIKNNIGKSILDKLIKDKILTLNNDFYYLDQDKLTECLNTSWDSLRQGDASTLLITYLNTIEA
jgi:hypothetical protein